MSNPINFDDLFPFPAIRCRRIIRDTERQLGDVRLDGKTAYELGASNVGVFAGGCPNPDELIEKFRVLADCELPGQIVIAFSTNVLADHYFCRMGPAGRTGSRDDFWSIGCITFTTPEKLHGITKTRLGGLQVLAVGLVDPTGILHLARGYARQGFAMNDRPQHIARFRAAHEVNDWRPPFFLFTERRAKALSTNQMLAPYSLEAWWFVDGSALRTGVPPKIDQPPPLEEDVNNNVTATVFSENQVRSHTADI